MADDPVVLSKKTLEQLKSEAFAELERRGYEVRGKTPAQIRQMLRRRQPTKLDPILSQAASSQKP
jgi:hypothetical protein